MDIHGCKPRVKSTWSLASLLLLASCTAHVATRSPASTQRPTILRTQSTELCGEPDSKTTPVYKAPGRKTGSKEPWAFFLGNAAHEAIAHVYGVYYPGNTVYYNRVGIRDIVKQERIGDGSRLQENEREIRPDITDISDRVLFEVKPDNEEGLQEGREKVQQYLAALNRTIVSGERFVGGTGFQGAILLQFERGLHVWQLEWHTAEPGVTLYRWKRSQGRYDTPKDAYMAKQWEELPKEEMEWYKPMAEQVIERVASGQELPKDSHPKFYLVVRRCP
ncbi:hypothetical protein [Archangium sp.]|uniref:hypothetical protein n=1 Tax=Archangium sp. TaxID=1872627 RepID=UPI002D30B8D7|nr:hypothetical protein [Archangium sp.]HYO56280.1 hypothetical protein [Archangium sp.]